MSWQGPSLRLTRVAPSPCSDAELRPGVRALLLERWRALLDDSWYRVARGWVDRGEGSLLVVGSPDEPPGDGPAERLDLLLQGGAPAPRALAEHWLAWALAEDGGGPLRRHLATRGYALAADAALPRVDAARFIDAAGRLGLVTADGVEWQDPVPVRARDADLAPGERAAAAWVRAGGPCACAPCAAADRATPWRSALPAGPGEARAESAGASRTELSLRGDDALVREVGVAGGAPFDRSFPARLLGAVPGLGVAMLASERGGLVLDLRARRLLLEPTTVTERVAATRLPGADVDPWVARALGVRAALGVERAPVTPIAWGAPQPWPATGPGHERVSARAPGADLVLVRDGASAPVALRVRCSGPPSFEVSWKAETPGEVVVSAAVAPRQLGALRAALREAFASPEPAFETDTRRLAALEVWADAAPWVAPRPVRAAPVATRAREDVLRALATAAADVGAELSALDRGAGSWDRIGLLDGEAREAVRALPDLDRAELEPLAARGLTSAWSELEARARALLGSTSAGTAGAGRSPARTDGWAEAAARLREASEVAPAKRKPDLATECLRLAHQAATAGDLEAARSAYSDALAVHGNTARFALRRAPLNAWRAELAPAAFRSKLVKALVPHADVLAATLLPVTRLSAVPGGAGDGPTSRLGGKPSLPPGVPWPTGPDGAPLRFLLQVDLAAAPPQPPLPRSGLLVVFLVDGPGFGHGLRERAVRVLHVPEPPAASVEGPAPRVPLCEPCGLALDAEVEPAAPPDAAFARRCASVASSAPAVRALKKAHPLTGTKLGGYAFFTQEDPRARDPALAVHVQLLQLDELPAARLTLGDGGVGHVFVPAGDLARLDFSRAWWHWDCL